MVCLWNPNSHPGYEKLSFLRRWATTVYPFLFSVSIISLAHRLSFITHRYELHQWIYIIHRALEDFQKRHSQSQKTPNKPRPLSSGSTPTHKASPRVRPSRPAPPAPKVCVCVCVCAILPVAMCILYGTCHLLVSQLLVTRGWKSVSSVSLVWGGSHLIMAGLLVLEEAWFAWCYKVGFWLASVQKEVGVVVCLFVLLVSHSPNK